RNAVSLGTATADGSGVWHFVDTTTLSNATTYQYSAKQTDVAGNVSATSANYAATIDTTSTAPVITGFTTAGVTVGDHITNDQTLTIDGTAEPTRRSSDLRNAVSLGTATADGSGVWHFVDTTTLSNATTYQYSAKQTDVAGNVSATSANY